MLVHIRKAQARSVSDDIYVRTLCGKRLDKKHVVNDVDRAKASCVVCLGTRNFGSESSGTSNTDQELRPRLLREIDILNTAMQLVNDGDTRTIATLLQNSMIRISKIVNGVES